MRGRAPKRQQAASVNPQEALEDQDARTSIGVETSAKPSRNDSKRQVTFREDPEVQEVPPEEESQPRTEVWWWVDDMLEGLAEVYRVTIGGVHTCTNQSGRVIYPVKERVVQCIDDLGVRREGRQPSSQSAGRHGMTFEHERDSDLTDDRPHDRRRVSERRIDGEESW
eukprot:CAMPEP_0169301274 /NCGR_PEP_ID=MMETSP1016-20121227/68148_1 /TAXON_ID=342587 /ORGANISM="Karlodinium micrum, Strain CCMP2283" /LENGTH=167 /DNA_ID=CAMNT_0009393845 /DNA_START=63 /DNA_END=566 /DNA_ORIENTATION=-